jgi:Fe2+ transport system protein FeoA
LFRKAHVGESGASGAVGLSLASLPDGESARVLALSGGGEAVARLESMGILVGTVIEKRSSALRGGPIVVGRGSFQLAIAYAIAKAVLVEPLR